METILILIIVSSAVVYFVKKAYSKAGFSASKPGAECRPDDCGNCDCH